MMAASQWQLSNAIHRHWLDFESRLWSGLICQSFAVDTCLHSLPETMLDQPINAQSFTDYVEQCLAPTLSPGDVVIMDNLSSHKKPAIRRASYSTGCARRM